MTDVLEAYNRCGSCRHFVPRHTDRNGRTLGECRGRPTHPEMHAHEFGCPEYHVQRSRVVPVSPIPDDADLPPRQREAARRIEAMRAAQVSSRRTTEKVRMVRGDDDDDDARDGSQVIEVSTADDGPLTRAGLRSLLAEVVGEAIDGALGLSEAPLHPRYRGGKLIVQPGNAELQSKEMEIDVLFRKVVAVRDKLRVLEQKINASDKLGHDDKAQMQQYITGCYGSLTSFNYLFRDKDDWFVGEGKA